VVSEDISHENAPATSEYSSSIYPHFQLEPIPIIFSSSFIFNWVYKSIKIFNKVVINK